eukprot:RCo049285
MEVPKALETITKIVESRLTAGAKPPNFYRFVYGLPRLGVGQVLARQAWITPSRPPRLTRGFHLTHVNLSRSLEQGTAFGYEVRDGLTSDAPQGVTEVEATDWVALRPGGSARFVTGLPETVTHPQGRRRFRCFVRTLHQPSALGLPTK